MARLYRLGPAHARNRYPTRGPLLTAGTWVGAYEIVGSLGAVGMDEEHRARDPKLGREVARKVLPEAFAAPRQDHSRTDLLDWTRALFETFRLFDGRAITTVFEDLETSEGIRIDPALIRQLVDFRILVAPDQPSTSR